MKSTIILVLKSASSVRLVFLFFFSLKEKSETNIISKIFLKSKKIVIETKQFKKNINFISIRK